MSGSAVAIPWAARHVNAILEGWYPGESGGTAIADVLLGRMNPAGRLPVTFYRSTADLPAFTDYGMANRTYRYFGGQALYPFGYGLSYTHFAYGNLEVRPTAGGIPGRFEARIAVTNAGDRAGDEVVQLYAQEPAASRPRDRESLCAFQRVSLAPGETRTVVLAVSERNLRRWNSATGQFTVPRGDWNFLAGASSADIRQQAVAHAN
jgi:beta-glucosidase